jgi:hypothetical protein
MSGCRADGPAERRQKGRAGHCRKMMVGDDHVVAPETNGVERV